jgi:DNA-binding MarR family transcriptional regulator
MNENISDTLLQQIRSCTNLVHRLIHSEHHFKNPDAQNNIGRAQGIVLKILAEKDGMTQTEITEKLDIRPSSLGELVMKLEKNGYVERRQNENDKRVINVFLTEKGREFEKELINPRQKAAETWCAGLSEEDKTQLSELLNKLILSMEDVLTKNGDEFSGREIPFGGAFPEMDSEGFSHHGHKGRQHGGPRGEWRKNFRF